MDLVAQKIEARHRTQKQFFYVCCKWCNFLWREMRLQKICTIVLCFLAIKLSTTKLSW